MITGRLLRLREMSQHFGAPPRTSARYNTVTVMAWRISADPTGGLTSQIKSLFARLGPALLPFRDERFARWRVLLKDGGFLTKGRRYGLDGVGGAGLHLLCRRCSEVCFSVAVVRQV